MLKEEPCPTTMAEMNITPAHDAHVSTIAVESAVDSAQKASLPTDYLQDKYQCPSKIIKYRNLPTEAINEALFSTKQDTKSKINPIHLHLIKTAGGTKKTFIFGVNPGITRFLFDLIKYTTGCSGQLPRGKAGPIELLGDQLEDAKECLRCLQVADEIIHAHCRKGLQPRKLGRRG